MQEMGNCAFQRYKNRRVSPDNFKEENEENPKDSHIEEYKDNIELGRCHKCSGEIVEALVHFRRCLEISHIIETKSKEIESLSEIGVAYYDIGNYEMALDSFLKMYDCSKKSMDNCGTKAATSNLAAVYEITGKNLEAIQMYKEHIETCSENDRPSEVILTHYDIAMIYQKLDDTEAANEHLMVAFDLSSMRKHPHEKLVVCSQLANLYCKKGALDDALQYFEGALKAAKKLNAEIDMQRTHKQIGEVYLSLKQYSDAEFNYNETLRLAKKIGDKTTLAMAHMHLSLLYRAMGKKEDARYHKKQAVRINANIKKLPNGTNFTNLSVPGVCQSPE